MNRIFIPIGELKLYHHETAEYIMAGVIAEGFYENQSNPMEDGDPIPALDKTAGLYLIEGDYEDFIDMANFSAEQLNEIDSYIKEHQEDIGE